MSLEQPGFYSKEDLRSENRELALKMVFREIREAILWERTPRSCSYSQPFSKTVQDILDKWKVREEEIGTRLSVAISFPDGVVRNQWFYDANGSPYSKKHDGKPEKVVSLVKKSKAKPKGKPKPKC